GEADIPQDLCSARLLPAINILSLGIQSRYFPGCFKEQNMNAPVVRTEPVGQLAWPIQQT
ncbi:hypothetical protein, partial [Microcoleus sp. B4-C1]|uniref:hypothetical protein n=1 Tax=Microcoleus sp. B4-C1 TaxID=2818660 RepID=UPI002FD10345